MCLLNCPQSKTQQEYLKRFINLRPEILKKMYECEGIEQVPMCVRCAQKYARWRCTDCMPGNFCRGCCRTTHTAHPYHRLECWNGRFFQTVGMWQVGVRLHVGHEGARCIRHEKLVALDVARDDKDDERTQEILKGEKDTGVIEEDGMGPNLAAENFEKQADTSDAFEDPGDDDADWEDVNVREGEKAFAPLDDDAGHKFVIVVDITGVHAFPMTVCQCGQDPIYSKLVSQRLLPASFVEPRTMFTFRVLQDFRLSNLEAKTTAYQYFNKLRRVTNPGFPHLIPNRYTEFRRVTRMWRNLIRLKWSGFGLPDRPIGRRPDGNETTPGPGELAIFCPACPQPGINLPGDWESRYTS